MRLTSRTSVVRTASWLAATVAALALASACASEEIVLANVSSLEPGSGAPAKRCVENRDCSSSMFCARHDCEDVAGTCETRPVVCEEAPMPVCGCDDITYWNDCLRRTVGVPAMRPGECGNTALLCGKGGPGGPGGGPGGPPGGEGCPPGAACARLLPPDFTGAMCPFDVPGTCWALPALCPDRGGPDRWISCDPGRTSCVSTCDAIRTGVPHRRATSCP